MATTTQDVPYAAELREAEEIVARERRALMTPAERRAALIKDLSEKKIAEAAGQAESAKRMADPAVVSALATLQALKDRAAFDPNWSYGDIEALDRAERQLRTDGADIPTGLAMVKAAVGIEASKRQAIIDKIAAQRADLESQLASIEGSAIEYAITGQQPPKDSNAAWEDRLFALGDEMNAKQSAYFALPKDAPKETRAAAMAEWRSATDAVAAHRQSDPAATPAGEGT